MGNAAVAEELLDIDDIEEIDASEGGTMPAEDEPDDDDEDYDDDEDDDDEDDDDEEEPETMPAE